MAALADDTGLFIDALGGAPGVHSARYAGDGATFEDNVDKVLAQLEDVSPPERTARFRTVVALAYPDGTSWWVEGVLEGRFCLVELVSTVSATTRSSRPSMAAVVRSPS